VPTVTPTFNPPTASPFFPSQPPPPTFDPCGIGGIFCGPYGFAPTYSVAYTAKVDCGTLGTCELAADVYQPVVQPTSPAVPTRGWPLVVAIPGGPLPPGIRGGLDSLGAALAVRGVVTVIADWREATAYGGGYPTSFEDVACAIRFARATAPDHGADPSHVVLVAHSFGGFPGAVVSLSPKTIPSLADGCLADEGSPRPDAYVGVAPISTLDGISTQFLDEFMGGTRDDEPDAWAASDPVALASQSTKYLIPVTILTGGGDLTVPTRTVEPLILALQGAGRDVRTAEYPGVGHLDILGRQETIDAILEAAGR
jgi:acetyl esterase/lipase